VTFIYEHRIDNQNGIMTVVNPKIMTDTILPIDMKVETIVPKSIVFSVISVGTEEKAVETLHFNRIQGCDKNDPQRNPN
jgi:hypothetical protein